MAARLGGATYIAASLGFLVVFAWLAAHFGYPDVLDAPAAEVLPRLLALGGAGRVVWIAYAVLPLMLVPAAIGAAAALRGADTERSVQLGVVLQVVAALAMTIGLARWSTAQWSLAESWASADAGQQAVLATVFDALNAYFGNAIGEFLGELALYGSFMAFAVALQGAGWRRMAAFGVVTALVGWIGMFRNFTPTVQLAADVTNVLLPLFLIALGAMVMRQGWTTLGNGSWTD